VDGGTRWKSVCINPSIYLPYLVSQCLKHNAIFRRGTLRHISHAPALHHSGKADIVVNCTGLQARNLGGVEDKTVFPARGQIVLVRNVAPVMVNVSGTDDGGDEAMYIMTRAAGTCRPSVPIPPPLITDWFNCRWRDYSRRNVSEEQLGFHPRHEYRPENHEEGN
jgi:glycine/D-amino acid oxidase-like deaminating enzyme